MVRRNLLIIGSVSFISSFKRRSLSDETWRSTAGHSEGRAALDQSVTVCKHTANSRVTPHVDVYSRDFTPGSTHPELVTSVSHLRLSGGAEMKRNLGMCFCAEYEARDSERVEPGVTVDSRSRGIICVDAQDTSQHSIMLKYDCFHRLILWGKSSGRLAPCWA